ncbi:peptidylprolyl isomerase [uncultured Tenacibaculum sp.]|uniref:peptidylprolyl isomerase n=1 Tax=uncultured Tenacibaculum sp. TaxID=174713 RepID=UPI00260B4604|nr:peptidylprolyl isomerase [uncultured Tenacibaculum sp.]
MRKQFLYFFVCFVSSISFAQKEKELFRINNEPVMVSEFKQVYEKNLAVLEDDESKDIDKYLELYINYKLKVKEAYGLKLDTLKAYKRELEGYKKQLIAPYLQDNEYLNRLIKEAYHRTTKEVRASHILIKFPKKRKEKDTLVFYKRIEEVRKRILSGESFEKVAKEASEDPSAKINGGDLGCFSAFTMVYPFEDAAYKTKLNEVSKPFKTRFGYHILKVTGKRESKGEFEVAHILINKTERGKEKVDSLYKALKTGANFNKIAEKYSEDRGTASLGGKLPRFGTGKMVESFENVVRKLEKEGDYSKPFKTKYGWHIVKLLKKYPVGSFDDIKNELTKKVKKSNRAGLSKQAVLNKLKKEYKIVEYKKALNVFLNTNTHMLENQKLKEVLFSINNKKVLQKDFMNYIGHKHNHDVKTLYEKFKNIQIIEYFKNDLINKEPEYRNVLLEYKEGLLLFDLMQRKIWNRASKDTLELKELYRLNKSKYKNKKFEEVRGHVMNDYQKKLEKEWVKNLRENNKIRIRERELKKFKKTFNQ